MNNHFRAIKENFLALRKSGIIDYIILEILYILMIRNDIFEIIGREFLKIIFISFLIYQELFCNRQFVSLKKNKSISNYLNYIFINFIFIFNRTNSDDNTKIIIHTIDLIFFINLYYLFRKDLKSYSKGTSLIISQIIIEFISLCSFRKEWEFLIYSLIYFYILYNDLKILIKNNSFIYKFIISLLFILNINLYLNLIGRILSFEFFYNFFINIIHIRHIIIYWIIIILSGIILTEYISSKYKISKNIKRKFFHFISTLIFIPGLHYIQADLFLIICIIILTLFVILEFIRNKINTPFFNTISEYLKSNIDKRDDENFIITHILLLFSSFSSLLYSELYNMKRNDIKYIGIIILGIGDASAAIIGSKFGKLKIYPPTNRTLEGTIAGIISSTITYYIINKKISLLFIPIFIYEGLTLEIDNLVLTIYSFRIFYIFN